MDLKQVILTISNEQIDFIVYDTVKYDGSEYVLLIVKMIYLEMLKSIVDMKALEKAINIYSRFENQGKIQYIKVSDETTIQEILKLSVGTTGV